jgi:hypothetical protein
MCVSGSVNLAARCHLLLRSRMVDLYLHSATRLHCVKHRANTSRISSQLTCSVPGTSPACISRELPELTRSVGLSRRSLLLIAVKASSPDAEILLTNGPSRAELLTDTVPSVGLMEGCPASNQSGRTKPNRGLHYKAHAISRYIDTEICPQTVRSIKHKLKKTKLRGP